jgi:hypothetical protein
MNESYVPRHETSPEERFQDFIDFFMPKYAVEVVGDEEATTWSVTNNDEIVQFSSARFWRGTGNGLSVRDCGVMLFFDNKGVGIFENIDMFGVSHYETSGLHLIGAEAVRYPIADESLERLMKSLVEHAESGKLQLPSDES